MLASTVISSRCENTLIPKIACENMWLSSILLNEITLANIAIFFNFGGLLATKLEKSLSGQLLLCSLGLLFI